jgi:serine/threonine protein kinase
MSIVHRDIKSSNILLDERLVAKVSDFGASRDIPIDQTGVNTAVQGTFGYLDPEYYHTWRLTEKSDVYSFGVILVELLTRKKPFDRMPSPGASLTAEFILLVNQDKLSEILDPQVTEEGGQKAKEVAAIAVMCLTLHGEDRPTMRQLETRLEALLTEVHGHENIVETDGLISNDQQSNGNARDNISRRCSMEEEFLCSMSLPR